MLNKEIVSVDLLTCASCPMNCRYCYIPKSLEMGEMQKEIIEDIKSGETLSRVKKLYGENLECLGLWGTEPTITMPYITEKIEEILKIFPKLYKISYSTSGITNQDFIISMVKELSKYNRDIIISHQISLDGPEWLTDMNRMPGSFNIVTSNFIELVEKLNLIELGKIKFEIRWKPTIDIDNMKEFIKDEYKITEYLKTFDDLKTSFNNINKNNNIILIDSRLPSLVVPGKYTSNDGKIFARFMSVWHKYGITTYTPRLQRIKDFINNIQKKRMFTCSGGRSSYAVGKNIYICHRSLFFDDERYIKSILNNNNIENWDISLFDAGMIKQINEKYIVGINDDLGQKRIAYVYGGHNDYWKFEISYIHAILNELIECNMADPELINNEGLFELFALFMISANDCPMENLLNTGSIHLTPISMIKLWGNGAFTELLKK